MARQEVSRPGPAAICALHDFVVSHGVHQKVATTGGADIVAPWLVEQRIAGDRRIAGIRQVHETLFGEASLNQTNHGFSLRAGRGPVPDRRGLGSAIDPTVVEPYRVDR